MGLVGKIEKKPGFGPPVLTFWKRPQFEAVHDNVHPLISYSLHINNL